MTIADDARSGVLFVAINHVATRTNVQHSPKLKLLRFADLKAAQVVTSWPQLKRLVDNYAFPRGYLLSPAVRVWDASEVEDWLDRRRQASMTDGPRERVTGA